MGKKGTVIRPFHERFWEKVDKTRRCWVWIGAINGRSGHGRTFMDGRRIIASRASWIMHNGPVPDGVFVLHRCDNAPCVRPDHLYLGTLADNNHDAEARGRRPHPQWTVCKRGHPLTPDNVYRAHGRQRCRTCHNAARRVAKGALSSTETSTKRAGDA